MAFTPGHTLSKGRQKGSKNKRTLEFLSVLEESNFCPATALMAVYKIAMERFIQDSDKEDRGIISPMESSAATYLKIAADHASHLASYAHPKLKAIEQTKENPLDNMSAEEKLEAMRQAVRMLEAEVKPSGRESS